ncbi:hypothetical protein LAZ67_1003655 [Cordylochernes scorpioides]|uniref:RNase H type-1 domain-containing protein n=1 Tax=Cordylochernes scorpioides TaxID=51811 RepID=A0ABY6JX25_9ARAC|nr:hypothetical protein LAZ67_1003655 [Cordylochernes scorpioides]
MVPGQHKLTLSPNKSSILPIFCNEPTIHIQNSTIPCVEDMTILGVNFNSRFSFSPHLNKICDKILKLFPRLRSCANNYYGFSYRARKLFYHSVIEQILTYAAPIWAEAADTIAGRSRLRSTQRKFCINAIHGFRTVPTLASFALLRVEHPPPPYSYPQPHLLRDLSHLPIPESTPDISYYTDGSKTSSGAGSGIFRTSSLPSTPCLESSLSLSKHCTVFQAESFALLTALKDISTMDHNLSIGIFSDCLSLLCTLARHRCLHPIVHKCQILLYDLLPTRKITLHWVRGHSGIEGNCRADALAKIGTYNPTLLNNLGLTPISLKTTHKHITPDTAITTGFITGHTWIGANKHSKSKHDRSSCRHCGGPPETTEHIFLECPPLDNHRSILFSNCVKLIGHIPNTTKILFSNKKIWRAVLAFAHGCGRFSPSNKPPQTDSEASTSESD